MSCTASGFQICVGINLISDVDHRHRKGVVAGDRTPIVGTNRDNELWKLFSEFALQKSCIRVCEEVVDLEATAVRPLVVPASCTLRPEDPFDVVEGDDAFFHLNSIVNLLGLVNVEHVEVDEDLFVMINRLVSVF